MGFVRWILRDDAISLFLLLQLIEEDDELVRNCSVPWPNPNSPEARILDRAATRPSDPPNQTRRQIRLNLASRRVSHAARRSPYSMAQQRPTCHVLPPHVAARGLPPSTSAPKPRNAEAQLDLSRPSQTSAENNPPAGRDSYLFLPLVPATCCCSLCSFHCPPTIRGPSMAAAAPLLANLAAPTPRHRCHHHWLLQPRRQQPQPQLQLPPGFLTSRALRPPRRRLSAVQETKEEEAKTTEEITEKYGLEFGLWKVSERQQLIQ